MPRRPADLAGLTPGTGLGDPAAAREALLEVVRAMARAAAREDFAKELQDEARRDFAISLKRIADHLDERVAPKGHTYHGLSLDELARGESYHPGDDA